MRNPNKLIACVMALAVPLCTWAQTENEPNDAFNQANAITIGTAMNGDIGDPPCASGTSDDYFILNLAQDGKITINTNAANSGAGTSGLRLYVYNSGGGQIGYFDHATGANGVPSSVSSAMTCLNKGIYYFRPSRLNGSVCYTYALTVTQTAPVYADDVEPNNDFANALPLAYNTFTQGHLNFSYYGDNDDYYKITTPGEGTITVTMIAENAGASAGSVRTYLYNGSGGQIDYFDSSVGALADDDTTTASFTCYGQGAYYLRTVSTSGCGISYKMKYAITGAVYGNDLEPNNDFSQAALNPLLAPNTFAEGHVNFNHYGDNNDYYKISTSAEGTLRLTTIAERVPGSAGTLRIYVYNSGGGQINYYDASVGGNNDDDTTTVNFDCYGQGDYYLRVMSINGCGISYKLKYELLPAVFAADSEPNNSFAEALANPLLAHNTFTEGHVNFNHYGDNDDYYYIQTPASGLLRLTTIAERVPAAAGAVRVYVYNQGGGQLANYDASVGGNNDDDTTSIDLNCYAKGNYYLRVQSVNGCGISYKLKYELLPAVFAADAEPNNYFAEASILNPDSASAEGNLNFAYYGDNDDYYRLTLPANGSISIGLEAENTAGGTMRVYLYNNGGGQLNSQDIPVGAAHVPTASVVTFNSLPAGGYYIRLQSISGCGISYRMNCNDNDGDGICNYFDLCPAGPEPGTACDDGNNATINDVIGANCQCAGTLLANDCAGVPGGTAYLDNCNTCVGGTTGLTACVQDCHGQWGGTAYTDNCATCVGGTTGLNPCTQDCQGTWGGTHTVGTACNDGNPNTINDVYNASCVCIGTPIGGPCNGNKVVMNITTDGNPAQLTWLFTNGANSVVATGTLAPNQNNTTVSETVCLNLNAGAECYGFKLMDSFGDGITNGGWELRTTDGKLILADAFASGSQSPANPPATASYGSAHSFCLPLGPINILANECGIFNNALGNKVYCNKPAGATQYEFEFSDPDAGFLRRVTVNRNYVIFSELGSNITPGLKYFARVRTNVAGPLASAHWGSGCEMGLGVAQVVTCSELIMAPAYGHSCNESRAFNTNNSFIYAKPVNGANEYQFRIYNLNEGYDQTFTRSTYILQLKWNSSVAPPLVNGSTYNVQINTKVNGLYTGFCSSSCTISINNALTSLEQASAFGEAALWPNPVSDGQVNLSIGGLQDADQRISVDVQDLYGKQVFAQEFGNSGDRFNTILQLPGDIASGVYLVNITVNGQRTVQRLSIVK